MAKIVFASFLHETNTFAPDMADECAFELGGGWPGLVYGQEIFSVMNGLNTSTSGFIKKSLQSGDILIPIVWAAASPSAYVKKDIYEKICKLILSGIEQAMPVDAVYLDLHGAMVAQHIDDGEGELIQRVRQLVGKDIPIAVTVDLHANVTERMINCSDIMVAYRTYPHTDMAETGERCYSLLSKHLREKTFINKKFERIPFLIPICWQSTDIQPAKDLYALLASLETDSLHLSFTMGFPAADFPECSPVIWGYSSSEEQLNIALNHLKMAVLKAEPLFAGYLFNEDEAVIYAIEKSMNSDKPVVIADAQDNPGAGSNSDTTGILRALIRHKAKKAIIGLIVDPDSMHRIIQKREGDTIHLSLGGKSGIDGDSPLDAEFLIETISDGVVKAEGSYYQGFTLDCGPAASLRIGDVQIAVASYKVQMADRALFKVVGIQPEQAKIVVVKSAVHFRADFSSIAKEIIVCKSPGSMPMVLKELPWTNLQEGIRMDPMGEAFRK